MPKAPIPGHCARVPTVTEMMAEALCEAADGPFAGFSLDADDWYELRVAAWLHDCGKITTPVHVMDKATRLETITDRFETVSVRLELLKRDAEIQALRTALNGPLPPPQAEALAERHAQIESDRAFVKDCNETDGPVGAQDAERLTQIAAQTTEQAGSQAAVITEDELKNLCIRYGTLTDDERLTINGHMVQTVQMLESLPFPRNLRKVPEYACNHHERMDGKGYPRGIYASDMSVLGRVLAIADVFEALTAQDRPYKRGKTLSQTLGIMGSMKENNHFDPDLLDFFVTSGVYKRYAAKFLPPTLIDEVDEAQILAIKPKPFDTPDEEARAARWRTFLPAYQSQVSRIRFSDDLGLSRS